MLSFDVIDVSQFRTIRTKRHETCYRISSLSSTTVLFQRYTHILSYIPDYEAKCNSLKEELISWTSKVHKIDITYPYHFLQQGCHGAVVIYLCMITERKMTKHLLVGLYRNRTSVMTKYTFNLVRDYSFNISSHHQDGGIKCKTKIVK